MEQAIIVSNLSKSFTGGTRLAPRSRRTCVTAVQQVSFSVAIGERFALLGPNGAGKTTLVKMLATLILPTSGQAQVMGCDLDNPQAIKARIGMVTSEERSFFWRLSAEQNLEFFAHLQGIPSALIPARIKHVLKQVGLVAVSKRRFMNYSSGMRQRLSLARALLSQPRILFLDEPTHALDPRATARFHKLILDLNQRHAVTLFMTTHNLSEAETLAQSVAIMHQGQIRAIGTPAQLRQQLPIHDSYRIQAGGWRSPLPSNLASTIPGARVIVKEGQPGDSIQTEIEFPVSSRGLSLDQALTTLHAQGAHILDIERLRPGLNAVFDYFTHPEVPGVTPQVTEVAEEFPVGDCQDHSTLPRLGAIALAFLRRDLVNEASYPIAFGLQVLNIFFTVGVFYFISRLVGPAAAPYLADYQGDYFAFVLIGIAFAGYFGTGLSSFSNRLRQAQTSGTLEALLATPASLAAIILAAPLWDYLITTLRVGVFFLAGWALGAQGWNPGSSAALLLVLFLSITTFGSLGILAASFIMVLKRGDPVTWAFNAFFSLLGGVYYPLAVLPGWLQTLARFIPVTYAVDGMRQVLLGGASFQDVLPQIFALGVFSALLLPLSLLAFVWAVRRARIEGSLTHY